MKNEKDWTIMVYMAGDNNLSEEMLTQIKSIKDRTDVCNVNILVLYDSSYPSIPTSIYDFSNIIKPSNRTDNSTLRNYSLNRGDTVLGEKVSESFSINKFVRAILRSGTYKADRYALILSGHSDGILGKTILKDETPPDALNIIKLKKILKKSCKYLNKYTKGNKKKFDLLGFDGCLMGMFEVAYELKDIAKIMVASEGNIPSAGWNYSDIFQNLSEKNNIDEKEFGKIIVDKFIEYNKDYEVSGRSVDACAVNLEEIEPLAAIINIAAKFGYDILKLPTVSSNDLSHHISPEIAFDNAIKKEKFIDLILLSHYRAQTFSQEQNVDILDFAWQFLFFSLKQAFESSPNNNLDIINLFEMLSNKLSLPNTNSKSSCETDNIEEINPFGIVNNYLIAHKNTRVEYQFSKGISLFFPWSKMSFDLLFPFYKKLNFNKEKPYWMCFIEEYLLLTLRFDECESKTPSDISSIFNFFIESFKDTGSEKSITQFLSLLNNLRQHDNKQHDNKQHDNKGLETFYKHFGQIKNYCNEIGDHKH